MININNKTKTFIYWSIISLKEKKDFNFAIIENIFAIQVKNFILGITIVH